jgi:NADH-quinone oxidoreductase subunit L
MFRGLFLTFFGASRVEPEVEHHVHESSSKMTVPLRVLALFSIVVGYVSWPKAFGGKEDFDRYLEPVFKPSEDFLQASAPHAGPALSSGSLMVFALLFAVVGILVAYWFYLKFTRVPARLAERFSRLYDILIHKYYVDEFYNWLVVRPIRVGSEKILWQRVDAGAIDSVMVNGTGETVAGVGSFLRGIQSGNIRSYASWVLLGAALWLVYVLWPR